MYRKLNTGFARKQYLVFVPLIFAMPLDIGEGVSPPPFLALELYRKKTYTEIPCSKKGYKPVEVNAVTSTRII